MAGEATPDTDRQRTRAGWGAGTGIRAATPGLAPGICHRGLASRRVLAKVGFTETERRELDAVYGRNNLFTTRRL